MTELVIAAPPGMTPERVGEVLAKMKELAIDDLAEFLKQGGDPKEEDDWRAYLNDLCDIELPEPQDGDQSMKKIGDVSTDRFSLEVIECDCGYHMGIDSSYVEQVEDAFFEHPVNCPSCGAKILVRDLLGMPRFEVDVEMERTESVCKTMRVQAANLSEAYLLANEHAGGEDFGRGKDAVYAHTGGAWCRGVCGEV